MESKNIPWDSPAILPRLGRDPDVIIAEDLGVTREAVRLARKIRFIAMRSEGKIMRQQDRKTAPSDIDWNASNAYLAMLYNVANATIKKWREKVGRPRQLQPGEGGKISSKRWTDSELDAFEALATNMGRTVVGAAQAIVKRNRKRKIQNELERKC
jgi:hypothetical protein